MNRKLRKCWCWGTGCVDSRCFSADVAVAVAVAVAAALALFAVPPSTYRTHSSLPTGSTPYVLPARLYPRVALRTPYVHPRGSTICLPGCVYLPAKASTGTGRGHAFQSKTQKDLARACSPPSSLKKDASAKLTATAALTGSASSSDCRNCASNWDLSLLFQRLRHQGGAARSRRMDMVMQSHRVAERLQSIRPGRTSPSIGNKRCGISARSSARPRTCHVWRSWRWRGTLATGGNRGLCRHAGSGKPRRARWGRARGGGSNGPSASAEGPWACVRHCEGCEQSP